MSFRRDMDEYIDECLAEGVLPSAAEVIQEVEVAGQQGGPRDGGNPGKFAAGPPGAGSQASFQDHDTPPKFAGASQRLFTPARFSEQNRATPPARFGSAARMEDEEAEILQAVYDDLQELDEMSAAEYVSVKGKKAGKYMRKDWEKTKKRNMRRPFKRPMESQEGSDASGFSDEEVSLADLLDQEIDEAIVARGVGAAARKVPELVGRAARAAGRHPVIASVPVGVAGAGGTGYYGAKERKAAARGDKKAMMKARRKRKVASAVRAAPIAAIGFASGRGGVRQLAKAGKTAKAAKNVKFLGSGAKKGAAKKARSLRDTSSGQKILGGAGVLTGVGAGRLYGGRVSKGWDKGDRKSGGRLKAGRKSRRK